MKLCSFASSPTAWAATMPARSPRTPPSTPSGRGARPARLGWPFGFDPSLSEAGNLIRTAIHLANMRVLETAGSSSAYTGMGTTLVAALVVDGRLSVGHVGDSRLYRLAEAGCAS